MKHTKIGSGFDNGLNSGGSVLIKKLAYVPIFAGLSCEDQIKWNSGGAINMIAMGSDHVGLPLKLEIKKLLDELGLAYHDYGTDSEARCDYPVYAKLAAEAVADGHCQRGLIFCGTGIGISIAANKVKGIRCAVCSDCYSAVLSRNHNNSNMLALGSRVVGVDLARMIVSMWLTAEYEGGRHQRRVEMIQEIESGRGLD